MLAKSKVERLRNWRRFVVWKYDGERKVPVHPATGRKADCSDPGIWMDFETAEKEKLRHHSAGIGFVLDDTPFTLVDLDRCYRDGEVSPFASGVLSELRGVEEVSASRTGMHSLVQGEKPGERGARKKPRQEIEIYDRERFVAIADESIVDKLIPNRQEALTALYWRIFPQQTVEDVLEKPELSYGALTDARVLELARACKTTGRVFVKLYDHGDTSGYPSRSEAHHDLCRLLAYWTVKDAGQIERLFRESKLAETVERSNPQKYVRKTVQSGIKNQPRTYRPGLDPSAKDRVRELAERHMESIVGLDWSYRGGGTDKAIHTDVTRHAGEWSYLTDDGALDFNVNQQSIADRIGVSQWTVSKSLQRLRDKGLLIRLSKGHSGRNSYYRLPLPSAETTTMKQQGSGGSATTTMEQPPCVVHSSGEANTRLPLHSSGEAAEGDFGGTVEGEPEPLPPENPEPEPLPDGVAPVSGSSSPSEDESPEAAAEAHERQHEGLRAELIRRKRARDAEDSGSFEDAAPATSEMLNATRVGRYLLVRGWKRLSRREWASPDTGEVMSIDRALVALREEVV